MTVKMPLNKDDLPLRYRNLTPEQKAFICNGCGPKGGFIPVPDFCFTASCNHHDFNYWLGYRKKDRKKADKQFYQAMRADIQAYNKFWTRRRYSMWAWIYYRAVRLFGGAYFHFADKPRTWEDLEKAMKETG